jgi:hypothetical protein
MGKELAMILSGAAAESAPPEATKKVYYRGAVVEVESRAEDAPQKHGAGKRVYRGCIVSSG